MLIRNLISMGIKEVKLICGKCKTEQYMVEKRYGKKPKDFTLYCPNCKDQISPSICKMKGVRCV